MILTEGTMLSGYRVIDVIGIGGMAIVYRAEQVSLGREVALKVLTPALAHDGAFRARFRREGKNIAALDHPHIVPIYDSGEIDGRLFLAMRIVHGVTLAERMRDGGLSGQAAIAILRPIADALDVAHAARIVHPDFGVAKATTTGGFTTPGGFVGSYNYAAPEQILGHSITPASDVYGLAAVLYQCFTGQVPYPRDTDAGVLHAHVNAPLPSIPTNQPGADAFNALIARGIAKAPEDRFSGTGELIATAARIIDRLPERQRAAAPTFRAAAERSTAAAADSLTVDAIANGTAIAGPLPGAPRGEATTAVQRRPPNPLAGSFARHPRRTAAATGTVAVAGVVAALVALSGPGRLLQTARSGPVSIAYAKPWTAAPVPATLTSLFSGTAIQLVDNGTDLAGGALSRSAAVPGELPPSLELSFGRPTRTSDAKVARSAGREYQWSTSRRHVAAFVVGLIGGDAAVVCQGTGALAPCATLAENAGVNQSAVLAPGADAQLAARVRAILAPVVFARRQVDSLSQPTLAARAPVAMRLADADATAAHQLQRISAPARFAISVGALRTALSRESNALSDLSRAARANHRSTYVAAASRAQAASRAVAAASSLLSKQAVVTTPLHPLHLARLPAPAKTSPSRPAFTSTSSTTTTSIVTPNPVPNPTPTTQQTSTSVSHTTSTTQQTTTPGPL
jgi:hypothetical protein